jgi:hypothetical protein
LPRYRDRSRDVGNLPEGQTLFGEPIVEVVAGRSYTYEAELARIRAHNFGHAYAAPPYRPAPYRHRSLRRS